MQASNDFKCNTSVPLVFWPLFPFRCIMDGKYHQAMGIAIECRRLDILEEAIIKSDNVQGTLSYCINVSHSFVNLREYRREVRLCSFIDDILLAFVFQIYVIFFLIRWIHVTLYLFFSFTVFFFFFWGLRYGISAAAWSMANKQWYRRLFLLLVLEAILYNMVDLSVSTVKIGQKYRYEKPGKFGM